jgi:mono/diheme cytochrome c family protein
MFLDRRLNTGPEPSMRSGLAPRLRSVSALVAMAVASLALVACLGATPPSPAPASTMATKVQGASVATIDMGAELYAAHCQVCHGDREGRGTGPGAPPHNEAGHTWHHADAQLKDWIINGKLGFGQMPAFGGKLTEPEVDAILRHIKTWWTPEQRETQADVSRRYQEALDR